MPSDLDTHKLIIDVHPRSSNAALTFALAPRMVIGGHLVFGKPVQASKSAYDATVRRDWFVALLCAVGASLF